MQSAVIAIVNPSVRLSHAGTVANMNRLLIRELMKTVLCILTRKLCYRKGDRAMRPFYRLFYPNFIHAYVHYFVRI